jgi:hypothetical protein
LRLISKIIISMLIFIIAVEPAYANSDIKKLFTAIPWDKQLHFTWGFLLTTTITALTGSLLIGFTLVILLELTKEYIIDDYPDCEDITYTEAGSILGCLISDILMNLRRSRLSNSSL